MSENLLGQMVLSARDLGIVPLGNVKHVYGNTATALTRPSGKTAIVLDVESGSFRAQIGDTSALGDDLLTNGDFAAATGWDADDGWTISGGSASTDGSQTTTINLSQTLDSNVLYQGYEYTVAFTVSGRTAGGVTPILGGTTGTQVTADGAATEDIRAGSTEIVTFQADADFDGSIDDISVKIKAISASAPSASNSSGGGTTKIRADQPVVFAGPSVLTVVGSGATDILTYWWV